MLQISCKVEGILMDSGGLVHSDVFLQTLYQEWHFLNCNGHQAFLRTTFIQLVSEKTCLWDLEN